MQFINQFFKGVVLIIWAGCCYADVQVTWEPSNDGSVMKFRVISANSNPFPADFSLGCGLFSKCFVNVHVGYFNTIYTSPDIPSSPGNQKASTLIARWATTSPVVVISNWGKLVEMNGGVAPCVVFNLSGAVSGGNGFGSFGSSCDGTVNPPEPPKPPVSCYLNGNVYLQHGALAETDVSGNRAETVAYVVCTGAAKVKVRALSSVGSDSYLVSLRADGSLKSMLAVNGFAGNGGVMLDVSGASAQPVTFSSLLIPSGAPAPGDFSGSAVAVVDIM